MKIQLAMSIYICLMNYLYVSVKTKVQTLKKKILKDKREKSRIEALKKERTEVYSFNILSIMHTKKVNSK